MFRKTFKLILPALIYFSLLSSLYSQRFFSIADSTIYEGDSVILYIEDFRGDIQWQRSFDLNVWDSIPGANYDSLKMIADSSAYFRAKVTEGTCNPIFSDTTHLIVNGGSVSETGNFTDTRDSHEYQWVKIGKQVWMAENLAFLPTVYPSSAESTTVPYYYVYDYQGSDVSVAKGKSNYSTYGVLYNWPSAINACPDGWHLPSDLEWKVLEICLGMSQSEADDYGWRGTNEGNKLKSTSGWYDNGNGSNESSFSALPGGRRGGYTGTFAYIDGWGYWWSDTETDTRALYRLLLYTHSEVSRVDTNKKYGYSVRCIKDE